MPKFTIKAKTEGTIEKLSFKKKLYFPSKFFNKDDNIHKSEALRR